MVPHKFSIQKLPKWGKKPKRVKGPIKFETQFHNLQYIYANQVFLQKIEFENISKSGFSRISITLSNGTFWEINTNLACANKKHKGEHTYRFEKNQ